VRAKIGGGRGLDHDSRLPQHAEASGGVLRVERLDRWLHRPVNSDMLEVWMRTQDNIPIDIYP